MKTQNNIVIRKATSADLTGIEQVYDRTHTAEEQGLTTIGWKRGIYPTLQTAQDALRREDLFVLTDSSGAVLGAAILNHRQVDVYEGAPWQNDAPPAQIMVMHTLVIDPPCRGMGLGRIFEEFYVSYARKQGCTALRIDTNARNTAARAFYRSLGYAEIAIRPCVFNGLTDVELVLLEKRL